MKTFQVVAKGSLVDAEFNTDNIKEAVEAFEGMMLATAFYNKITLVSNNTGEILRSYDVEQNTSGITATEYRSMLYCELCGLYNI
jgi:hypothetical protein